MQTITVHASSSYDIRIGSGLLCNTGKALLSLTAPCRVCILSDDRVFPLYGDTVRTSLAQAGFSVSVHIIPNGEASKCMQCYADFLNAAAEAHLSRSDWMIALGGGVTGDLCGFAAATYLRGIRYVQIPTSLLAMVDSSVGGKTAIDLPAGKNLCGAFYPPSLVLCDTDALSTLPAPVFAEGMAEVIKYGMIFDRNLLSVLADRGLSFDREPVITACIAHKCRVVEADEFDRGERQLLNFGHTPAHAIEKYSGYQIPHGRAVAMGMALITRAAVDSGFCDSAALPLLLSLLRQFSLPAETGLSAKTLADAVLSDKKRSGDTITLILPKRAGQAVLYPCRVSACEAFFEKGLPAPDAPAEKEPLL